MSVSLVKGSFVLHNTKVAKLISAPDRDGWVKLEYADKTPEQKVKVFQLKPATEAQFNEIKWKSGGFDDRSWAVGTIVSTTVKTEELLGTTRTKVKSEKIGKLVHVPDANGDVKIEYPDGTRSGMISVATLLKASADDWDAAVERTRDVHGGIGIQKHSVGKDTRGAKPPGGIDLPMFLTSELDMKIAFDMLDADREGALDKPKARNFLRCMGWCLSDEELDAMLFSEGGNKDGTGLLTGTKVSNGRTKWPLNMLMEVVDQNRHMDNVSLENLQSALRRLSSGRGKIQKDKFMQFATADRDLSESNLSEILASIGMESASLLDCDQLAHRLLHRVCDPPSIMDQVYTKSSDDV